MAGTTTNVVSGHKPSWSSKIVFGPNVVKFVHNCFDEPEWQTVLFHIKLKSFALAILGSVFSSKSLLSLGL